MLSKNKLKYIQSLKLKKNRDAESVFVAEGPKTILDLFGAFTCKLLIATSAWLKKHPLIHAQEIIEVTQSELEQASFLKNPQDVLAVFEASKSEFCPEVVNEHLCIVLDDVQDPGNLGTILRLADWFGIEHVICSPISASVYNPKTVQATMGALARVKTYYLDLSTFFESLPQDTPVYGTFLEGTDIYETSLLNHGVLIMGNEGNGISEHVARYVTDRKSVV